MRDRTTSVKGRPEERRPAGAHPVDAVDPDGTNVLFDVWLLSRATTGALDAALAGTGLTAEEFGVYSVLTSADALTPSELARWLSAPPTTVSSFVKRLEARGHLVRQPNPDDGRSSLLRLTAAGRRAHARAGAAFLPVLDEVTRRLGRRERAVRDALALLRECIDAVGPGDAAAGQRVGTDRRRGGPPR